MKWVWELLYIFGAIAIFVIFLIPVCSVRSHVLGGHIGDVTSIAFSPDGKLLASSGYQDGTVKLWSVTKGREIRSFQGETETTRVNSVAFSPDGKLLASGSCSELLTTLSRMCKQGKVRVWDVANGCEVYSFSWLHAWVESVAFSPDGEFLAASVFSDSSTIEVWKVATGQKVYTFSTPTYYYVELLTFSPDGKLLAARVGGWNPSIILWRMDTKERSLLAAGPPIGDFASISGGVTFSPDGKLLASSWDETIKLWEVSTGREVRIFSSPAPYVKSVAFSPDGRFLAAGGGYPTFKGGIFYPAWLENLVGRDPYTAIRLWEVSTGKEVRALFGHRDIVNSLAFSPDGRLLASGAENIRLWYIGDLMRR